MSAHREPRMRLRPAYGSAPLAHWDRGRLARNDRAARTTDWPMGPSSVRAA
jgi:hypothetical protein